MDHRLTTPKKTLQRAAAVCLVLSMLHFHLSSYSFAVIFGSIIELLLEFSLFVGDSICFGDPKEK